RPRGHRRRRARRRGRLAAVRVQVQAGRSDAPALRDLAVPLPARLADVVRGHVTARGLSPDPASGLEAAPRRPGSPQPPGARSLPRRAPALRPRPAPPPPPRPPP